MPFVTKEHRENPDLNIPGDRCYVYYKKFVDTWKENPRWTTADGLYQLLLMKRQHLRFEELSALELAWQVFFIKYVMPYEDKKEAENGGI